MPALFKNYHPFTVLVLLIFALLGNLQLLFHPELPVVLPGQVAYGWLVRGFGFLLGKSAIGYAMMAAFLLFAQALYLNHIAVQYRMLAKPNYLPAFCYLLLTALHPGMGAFSPQLFANWALLGALQAGCSLNGAASPRKQIFNLGFLLALAALLAPANLLFFGCLIAAMVLMRSFKAGEWVVGLLGYLTPFYFFAGILFLTDQLQVLARMQYFELKLLKPQQHLLHTIGTLSGLALIFVTAIFVLQQSFSRMAISVRRTWLLCLAFFIIAVPAVALALPQAHQAHWLSLAPGLALLTALPLQGENSRKLGILLFWFLIVLLFFAQLSLFY